MSTNLIPIAVSSQLDVTGEEKIHAASLDTSTRDDRRLYIAISGDMSDGFVGDATSGAYTVTGGSGSHTISLGSGTLPPGVTLATNGTWSGTFQGNGDSDAFWDYTFAVLVTDDLGNTATVSNTVRVTNFSISGDVITGVTGDASTGSYTNTHGYGPITYSVSDGTFPAGLLLASDGTWNGTRTTVGTYNWTVQALDAAGNIATIPDSADIFDTEFWIREVGGIGNDTVIAIDATTLSTTNITVGDGQGSQIAMSQDFSSIYAPNDASRTLSVIDTATKTVSATQSLAGMISPRLVACDDTYIYIADISSTNKKIRKLLVSDLSTVLTGPDYAVSLESTAKLARTLDGQYLLTASSSEIYVVNTSDLTVAQTVSVTGGVQSLCCNATKAFFIIPATGKYGELDLSTFTVTERTVGGALNDICLSDDGSIVYLLKDNAVATRYASTGAAVRSDYPTNSGNYGFALNASGTRLMISRNSSTDNHPVTVLDLASGSITETAGIGNYGIATCSRPLP